MKAQIGIALVVAALALAGPARADDVQDAVRKITETRSGPLVIVEFDLKRTDGKGGSEVTLQGLIVSEDGLVLVSGANQVDPPLGSSNAKPEEFSVRFPGDVKRKAEFVGKDEELNLALLKLRPAEEKEEKGEDEGEAEEAPAIVPASFAEDVAIESAGQLIATRRLGKVDDDLLTFGLLRITTVIPRPALPTEYRVTGNLHGFAGCPVWSFPKGGEVRLVGYIAAGSRRGGGRSYRMIGGRMEVINLGGGSGHATRILDAKLIREFLADPTRFARRDCWLGAAGLQALTKDLAEALGLEEPGGIVVGKVREGSPAEKAGFQAEDVIAAVDGEALDIEKERDIASFRKSIRRAKAGETRAFQLKRKEGDAFQEVALSVTLEEAPLKESEVSEYDDVGFGLKLKPLTRDFLERSHLPLDLKGVRVTSVERASWASLAEIRTGDVIRKIVLLPCESLDKYKEIMAALRETREPEVCYNVMRRRKSLFLCVRPDWNMVEALK